MVFQVLLFEIIYMKNPTNTDTNTKNKVVNPLNLDNKGLSFSPIKLVNVCIMYSCSRERVFGSYSQKRVFMLSGIRFTFIFYVINVLLTRK